MALLALGPVPYIVSAIAFPAALSTVSLVLVKQRQSGAFRKGGVVSLFVLVALTTVFIVAGRATLVGSIASLLLGTVGALLGVRLWNRWWAPILDAREYFRSRRHRSFDRSGAGLFSLRHSNLFDNGAALPLGKGAPFSGESSD